MELNGLTWRFVPADVSTTNPITRDRLLVHSIAWQGATNAAHAVVLKDIDGVERWRRESTAADYEDEELLNHQPQHAWNGLLLTQLDSGVLIVTLQ